ncbi:MAG: hypothetical protein ACE5O2_17025, partial [Armatimonadota bacterium]
MGRGAPEANWSKKALTLFWCTAHAPSLPSRSVKCYNPCRRADVPHFKEPFLAYADLREYVRRLEAAGELKRIGAQVSCELEITEIADRAVKSGGPALLFENV